MKFERTQHLGVSAERAMALLADPDFALAQVGQEAIKPSEIVAHRVDGHRVHLEVRYHFVGELNAAARAVLDPAKLSWVQVSEHDFDAQRVAFHLLPDNYADRLTCRGRYRIVGDSADVDASSRILQCEVNVRAMFVASQVERVLVDGFDEQITAQASQLVDWPARP